MSEETNPLDKTIAWNCSGCGQVINLPIDTLHAGQTVQCSNCGLKGVLVTKTFPFTCVKCNRMFNVPLQVNALGGYVHCPSCNQRYRRNKRTIHGDSVQLSGRLIPVQRDRYGQYS